ncbi:adhesion G-protein coupled receptor D1-like [Amphiura filiformis]|uniref:adhesion G-protein coupled receptor D1-like n=1 Tax=Amphiura filiformis TaxID=82378 RepID=UPI003B218643
MICHFTSVPLEYADGSICWISGGQGLANLFAFGLPVSVCLVINVVFFVITVVHLYQARLKSRELQNNVSADDWEQVTISAKISSIIGFTWALGYVAGFTNVAAVWWIFIIINSMQGVFIFLAFGINSRIRSLLRDKFG